MNYHIFPPDKFFDSYIEDVNKLHQENNNVFWVRGDRKDNMYLQTNQGVTFIGNDTDCIVGLLRTIKSSDKLFVSWYDTFIGLCILKANIQCNLFVFLMGGDFYDDPPGYHNHWLFDSETYKIVKGQFAPPIHFVRHPRNWHKTIAEIKEKRKYKKKNLDRYNEKLDTIKRIDYLVTAPNNQFEVDLIKQLYPTYRAKYVYGVFDQNVDLVLSTSFMHQHEAQSKQKILLGNSADPTNNHLDACRFIKRHLTNTDYEIYSPLAYGEKAYSTTFQTLAFDILGNSFHPLTNFMTRKKYLEFLDMMDVVIMYHNRQQAYGNIISSIMLGKPVFLKSSNPAYHTFISMGITSVYQIEELNDRKLREAVSESFEKIDTNRSIIKNVFSEEKRLSFLSQLL